eukprot:Gb_36467 [translate_table: standard]
MKIHLPHCHHPLHFFPIPPIPFLHRNKPQNKGHVTHSMHIVHHLTSLSFTQAQSLPSSCSFICQVGSFIEILPVSRCLPAASQTHCGSPFEGHMSSNMAHMYLEAMRVDRGGSKRPKMLHDTGYRTHNMTKEVVGAQEGMTPFLEAFPRPRTSRMRIHSITKARAFSGDFKIPLQIVDWKGSEGGKLVSSKEWESFVAVNEGQHNNEYQLLEKLGVLAYAQDPVLYLPYPIIVEMLRQYDNGAFWFFNKVVSIDAPLINQIIGLPLQGHEIERDIIIQSLYQGYEGTKSQNPPKIEQAQELPEDLVPPPKLKKVKEKRKGRFNPSVRIVDGVFSTKSIGLLISHRAQELTSRVQELELELILQADQSRKERAQLSDKISMLTSKINKLNVQPAEDKSATPIEVPSDIQPYVDLLKQKAKVLKEISLVSSVKEVECSKVKSNYVALQLRCGILERELQNKEEVDFAKRQLIQERHKVSEIKEQRWDKDEGYQEIAKSSYGKRNHFLKVSEVKSSGAVKKDLREKSRRCLGRHSTIHQIEETGNRRVLPTNKGIGFIDSGNEASSEMLTPNASRREMVPPTIDIKRIGTIEVGPCPSILVPSSPSLGVVLALPEKEFIPEAPQTTTPLPDLAWIGTTSKSSEASALDSVPLIQCDSPPSGTENAQQKKDSSLPTIEDATIPKAQCTKRKNPPSMGGPTRTHVRG